MSISRRTRPKQSQECVRARMASSLPVPLSLWSRPFWGNYSFCFLAPWATLGFLAKSLPSFNESSLTGFLLHALRTSFQSLTKLVPQRCPVILCGASEWCSTHRFLSASPLRPAGWNELPEVLAQHPEFWLTSGHSDFVYIGPCAFVFLRCSLGLSCEGLKGLLIIPIDRFISHVLLS